MTSASAMMAFAILNWLWFAVGFYVFVALTRQVRARDGDFSQTPAFGLIDGILAVALTSFLLFTVAVSFSRPGPVELTNAGIIASFIITVAMVALIVAVVKTRGGNVANLAGFGRLGAVRAIGTGAILLVASYPLVWCADIVEQRFVHGARQNIVELFNTSGTITQRVIIIIFAVAIAPAAEEFIFRFFLYGVFRRYFGLLFGIVANAFLFAAVHAHLPSLAPLFVLAVCFTIAYEWSGSILVSMTMHSLFNATTLFVLAFPETFRQ
jgi:membrane protease YdiL (CAAX protease family)